jgi:hypothetical protein
MMLYHRNALNTDRGTLSNMNDAAVGHGLL